jgi:AcrR family transcriptional regulator
MIANKLNVTRGNIYHHFKGGKDEIIDKILIIFDEVIQSNTPKRVEWMDINADARSVLSKLFFKIQEDDSERCRKINRIIFSDHHYINKIRNYVLDEIYEKREATLTQCFGSLIKDGKVKPFDTATVARILNHIYIAHALKDSHYNNFKKNELPTDFEKLQNDCMFIVRQILNGNFSA